MTLEQRVRRLERSCVCWRLACLGSVLLGIGACASTRPAAAPLGLSTTVADVDFNHITAHALTVQNRPGGPSVYITVTDEQAVVRTAGRGSTGSLTAGAEGASVFLTGLGISGSTAGFTSASVSADRESGSLTVRNLAGKAKVVEPE